MRFRKSRKYELSPETANTTLQNVFEACDRPPNTISFDKLILRQKVNTRVYDRLLILMAILLMLTFLLPLGIVPMAEFLDKQSTPEPVTLIDNYVEDSFLYLELSGDNILYEEAWMSAVDGEIIPGTYDEATGLIRFPFPDSGEYNIYVPVKYDDPFHLLLTLD